MLITPESSDELPWMSIWWLVKPHASYCVDILQARWLRLLNHTDCYVWLHQKNLWLFFMFEMHLVSGITDGWQGCEPHPPTKLNVKTRPLPSLYFGIYYSFGFSRLLFSYVFRSVFRWFRICYCFSTIFWVLASEFPSVKYPLAQTSSYVTAPDQTKVELQIRAMCRATSSILQ